MKTILTPTFLMLTCICALCQPNFQRSFGGAANERGHAIVATHDGGYAIAGQTNSFGAGREDFFIIKIDAQGTVLWQKAYGGPLDEFGYSMIMEEAPDFGLVLTGIVQGNGGHSTDLGVLKIDADGNIIWSNMYDTGTFMNSGDSGRGLSFTANGDILITGTDDSDEFGSNDGLLMRINSDGDLIWKKVFGGFSNEHFHEAIELPGGNLMVVGSTQTFGPGERAGLVIKTDAHGNLLSAKTYGGSGIEFPHGMVMTVDFDFVIGGVTNSYGAGQYDFIAFKIDSTGELKWTKTYGGNLDDWGVSIIHAPGKNGYLITGYTHSFGNGNRDILLVHIDPDGNVVWAKTFGTSGFDAVDTWANSTVVVTHDNGYALTGWSDSLSIAEDDVLFVKSDSDGSGFCADADVATMSHEMSVLEPPIGESTFGNYSALDLTVTNTAFVGSSLCYCTDACEECELIVLGYNLDDCYSHMGNGSDMDYSEFVPQYHLSLSYAEIYAGLLHRENPLANKHSCTPGVNATPAMCVSSLNSCTYTPGHDQSVVFEITIIPDPDSSVQLSSLSFFEKAPVIFDWINGASGPNNYPTLFGIRVLKNGVVIYQQSDIETALDIWTKRTFDFSDELPFIAADSATFRFELLPYCLINNGATVAAWDLDEISVQVGCDPLTGAGQNISGIVRNLSGAGMHDVQISMAHNSDFQQASLTLSDPQGAYTFLHSQAEGLRYVKANNNSDVLNGVSTLDLIYLQKHLLGLKLFTSPYQYIAADANNSSSLSVLDLIILRQLLLGKISEFPKNTSYRFLEAAKAVSLSNPWDFDEVIEIPNIGVDIGNAHFLGIKIGDVNNSSQLADIATNESGSTIILNATKRQVTADGRLTLDFTSENFIDIHGLQFALELKNASLHSIESGVIVITEENYSISENGVLYVSWDQLNSITAKPDDILFNITLNVQPNLKMNLFLADHNELLPSEAYQGNNAERMGLKLQISENTETTNSPLLELKPNPASSEITLIFHLPEVDNIELEFYNTVGNLVHHMRMQAQKGRNEIVLRRKDLKKTPAGTVLCCLKTSNSFAQKALILIE